MRTQDFEGYERGFVAIHGQCWVGNFGVQRLVAEGEPMDVAGYDVPKVGLSDEKCQTPRMTGLVMVDIDDRMIGDGFVRAPIRPKWSAWRSADPYTRG